MLSLTTIKTDIPLTYDLKPIDDTPWFLVERILGIKL
jgi:hypothetical protein